MSAPPPADHSSLAPVWQQRFAFFDRYGVPNGSRQAHAAFKALSFGERVKLTANLPAFAFGPIYFFVKGMWRKALAISIAGFAAVFLLGLLGFSEGVLKAIGIGVDAAAMLTANYAYYLHARRGSRSWNPFEGFRTR